MRAANRFEDLLPNSTDPSKSRLRAKLLNLLNSQGEIIPAAKSPLGKLWRLVNSATSSLDECEEVVQLDPALTSRIFRVANSAAYAAKATNVSEAIRFIGFKRVRELVFNAGVLTQFSNLKVPAGVGNILAAQYLHRPIERENCRRVLSDGWFGISCGIDSRYRLALSEHALPEEFARIMASEKSMDDAEKEVLPFSHANMAAAIAARSVLPLRAVDAIAYHHKQMLMTTSTVVAAEIKIRFFSELS